MKNRVVINFIKLVALIIVCVSAGYLWYTWGIVNG